MIRWTTAAPRGEVEGVGLIGRGHASDPLVASMGVGLAGEFFDERKNALGTTVGCSR